MAERELIQVRCRHSAGDIGPWSFSRSANVQTVKERILTDWPTDGTLGPEHPTSVADIRLILGGKFLENTENLDALRQSLGDLAELHVITCHVIIRQPLQGKSKKSDEVKCCSCVIC